MAQVFDEISVLDFTSGRAGGVATMVMADFGAEVVKVEPPGGEKFRNSPGAIQWNRGKKSVVLDLKTSEGIAKAKELALVSDVVIENFRPGVTERLGIDYDSLRAGHPALVYATLTGFGSEGPYAHYKGYDGVVAAKSGRMMMFSGQNPREGPNYVVTQGVCHAAATALIRGITAALFVRERTGLGQRVETSMLQAVTTYDHVSWIHGQLVENLPDSYPSDGTVGTGRPNPTGYLPARTDDDEYDPHVYGPELSRGFPGLRVWLCVKLYGATRLRAALAEKRALALEAAARVAAVRGIVMAAPPQVSLFAFHLRWSGSSPAQENEATELLVERVNLRKRVMLSGAVVEGRFLARVCVLSFRTRARHVEACVTDLAEEAADILATASA